MKVYIVTKGCYSDYHIEAVFTSRRKAELYVAAHNANQYSDYIGIEEAETDDEKITDKNEVIGYLFRAEHDISIGWYVPVYCCGEMQFKPKSEKLKWYEIWLPENIPIKAKKILRDRIAQHNAESAGRI